MELPASLSPSPEQEALELGLEHVIFDPIEEDARARAEAEDEETPPLRAYALLDASQSSDIPICLEGYSKNARCLFDGEAGEELGEVGPWLVEIERYSSVWDWFVEDGYGKNWGIFIHSRHHLPRLKTQLKKFLKVEDEEGDMYYFKYYRPQHLNAYLPTFEGAQLASFMKGIDTIFAEDQQDSKQIWRHVVEEEKSVNNAIDLIATGDPYRILPPSPEDAEIWIKAAQENT